MSINSGVICGLKPKGKKLKSLKIFSYPNKSRNYRKVKGNFPWILKNAFLNNSQIIKELSKKLEDI